MIEQKDSLNYVIQHKIKWISTMGEYLVFIYNNNKYIKQYVKEIKKQVLGLLNFVDSGKKKLPAAIDINYI